MIKRRKYYILLMLGMLFGIPNLDNVGEWNVLQEKDVWVGWTEIEGKYWCESRIILPFEIDHISYMINDKEKYPDIFKRIVETQVYGNVVYINLDMPFPFSSRDYIVKYSEHHHDNTKIYRWKHTEEVDVPIKDNCVRLFNAEGEWKLTSMNNGTKVVYRWNGELSGDFPDWALSRAWREQGTEVLIWLSDALRVMKK